MVVKSIDNVRETLVAIDGLLNWTYLSRPTRDQLEMFKVELQSELHSMLDQQDDIAA
jgi:hypothetical protein